MATLSNVKKIKLGAGFLKITAEFAGPASYDATNGDALDLSDYFAEVTGVFWGGVEAAADTLVKAEYVNDDMTDTDGGAIYYSWTGASGSAVLANVTNATNLAGYTFYVTAEGLPKNSQTS